MVQIEEQRRSAFRALVVGDHAFASVAELFNDRTVGDSDRGSGAFWALFIEQHRAAVESLRRDQIFLPDLARSSEPSPMCSTTPIPRGLAGRWLETLAMYDELVRLQPTKMEYRMELGVVISSWDIISDSRAGPRKGTAI